MARIFLSYRREDSAGFAGRLSDAIENEFGTGSVFRDVDDIRPGEDFAQAIRNQLNEAGAVLVMIGLRWLTVETDGRLRLENPDDFVRREIEVALATGKPVIPLLIDGASMPSESSLPESIKALAGKQAVALSDGNWRGDVVQLIDTLRVITGDIKRTQIIRRRLLIAGSVAALALLVWAFMTLRIPHDSITTTQAPRVDVTGHWTARVKYDWGDQYDEVFEFKYLGGGLHGTASYLTGKLTIEQASLEGDWLHFVTRSQEILGNDTPWKEVTHRYTGQLTSEGIRFTLESSGGYTIHPPVEFIARRIEQEQ